MTGQGEDILAWTNNAITARYQAARDADKELGRDWSASWNRSTDASDLLTADGQLVASGLLPGCSSHVVMNDPASVLRRCAADRKSLALYTETVAIRDRSAASIQAAQDRGHRPDPCVLDDWSRSNREAAFMLPLIQILAEGYGWAEGEQRRCGYKERHPSHTFMRLEVLFQCPGEHGTEDER